MVTALSGGSDDERASTPTEQLDGGEIKMLQTQLELARDKIVMLETEVGQLKRDGDQARPRSRLDSSDSKEEFAFICEPFFTATQNLSALLPTWHEQRRFLCFTLYLHFLCVAF